MKTKYLFILVISLYSFSTVAQTINDDISYQKSIIYLWFLTDNYTEIRYSEKPAIKKSEVLSNIENVLSCLNKELIVLKSKYPDNPKIKKLEEWIKVEQRACDNLKSPEWLSKPMWQLMYTLVKFDLQDIVIKELCNN